jgi:hypothetical protein
MSKAADQPLPNALIKLVDLLIESRIRIDAMEQILVKTNPVAEALYLGMIENLQRQKEAEVNRVLAQTLESQLDGPHNLPISDNSPVEDRKIRRRRVPLGKQR